MATMVAAVVVETVVAAGAVSVQAAHLSLLLSLDLLAKTALSRLTS